MRNKNSLLSTSYSRVATRTGDSVRTTGNNLQAVNHLGEKEC